MQALGSCSFAVSGSACKATEFDALLLLLLGLSDIARGCTRQLARALGYILK